MENQQNNTQLPRNPGENSSAGQNPPVEKKEQGGLKKFFSIMGNAVFVCILLVLGILVFAMVQSKITGKPPAVAGHQAYIVLGGSMSPTFKAGSLALIKPLDPQSIKVGDILTYRTTDKSDLMTTHRVVAVNGQGNELSFTTRGDANDVNDGQPVKPADIVGRVSTAIPYAGYLMQFAQTQKGLVALVFIPGVLIIIFELRNLFKYAAELEAEKKARELVKKAETLEEANRLL